MSAFESTGSSDEEFLNRPEVVRFDSETPFNRALLAYDRDRRDEWERGNHLVSNDALLRAAYDTLAQASQEEDPESELRAAFSRIGHDIRHFFESVIPVAANDKKLNMASGAEEMRQRINEEVVLFRDALLVKAYVPNGSLFALREDAAESFDVHASRVGIHFDRQTPFNRTLVDLYVQSSPVSSVSDDASSVDAAHTLLTEAARNGRADTVYQCFKEIQHDVAVLHWACERASNAQPKTPDRIRGDIRIDNTRLMSALIRTRMIAAQDAIHIAEQTHQGIDTVVGGAADDSVTSS